MFGSRIAVSNEVVSCEIGEKSQDVQCPSSAASRKRGNQGPLNQMKSFALLLFCGMCAAASLAQTSTGVISGTVHDPSGLAVVDAGVTLTNEASRVQAQSTTNGAGDFIFPSVLPGTYSISVAAKGFEGYDLKGLVLTATQRLSAGTISLTVGSVHQTITVEDTAATIQTASSERSAVLDQKQLSQLSTEGRDFLNMLKVLPGVSYPDNGGNQSLNDDPAPTINGVRVAYTGLTADGVSAAVGNTGYESSPINIDAISEVKVVQGDYQAEYGKFAGSTINAITKNGGQEFHGSAYEYLRNEAFNANNYFNNLNKSRRPRYRYNTVGYNAGGPIYWPGKFNKQKNKLFFFFSEEFQPNTTPGGLRTFTVPTAAERNGDFSSSVRAGGSPIVVIDPSTGNPFPNNMVPTGRIDSNMQKLLNVLPLPNFTNTAVSKYNYNYIINDSNDNPVHEEVLRLDWDPSAKWRFYARGVNPQFNTIGTTSAANSNTWGIVQGYYLHTPAIVANVSYFPTPHLVNELTMGLTGWVETNQIPATQLAKLQKNVLGIGLGQLYPSLNPLDLVPTTTFGGVTNAANIGFNGRFPLNDFSEVISGTDALTDVLGSHTIKVGVEVGYDTEIQYHNGNGGSFSGAFDFSQNTSNPLDTGYAYATAILGSFNTYGEIHSRNDYEPITPSIEWYLQDAWKVIPRLTIDYGVRFAYDTPQFLRTNEGGNFNPSTYSSSQAPVLYTPVLSGGKRVAEDPTTGQLYPAAYIGFYVPGTGNVNNGVIAAGTAGYPRGFVYSNGVLTAPRFGLSFDPFGDGKTAIRANFGVFYNASTPGGVEGGTVFNPPNQYSITEYYGTTSTYLAATGLRTPTNFNLVVNPHAKVLSMYDMSLGVQRDIGFKTSVDVAYVGNLGRHLGQYEQINEVPYGAEFLAQNQDPTTHLPLPDNFFRPYQGFGNLPRYDNITTSSYQSLQVQIQHKYSRGVQFSASYTWSKSMDYGSVYQTVIATYNSRRFWNYGPSTWDRTNQLVFNYVYDLPKVSTHWDHRPARLFLDNWQLSGITAFASGEPLGVGLSLTDAANLTGGGDGTSVVKTGPAIIPKGQRTFSHYFNTSVFQRPALYSIGSGAAATRYSFRGPGINNFDMTLFKNIPIKDKLTAQLRWEAYNVFNHTQYLGVNTSAQFNAAGQQVNTGFGQLTSARDPRIMQLALRIDF
jgi:hypothetical protein